MSETIWGARVCLVEISNESARTELHTSKLDLVRSLMASGRIVDSVSGGDAHEMALKGLIAHAQKVMADWPVSLGRNSGATPRTCNRHTDCDAADARAKILDGRDSAEHCNENCGDAFCEDCDEG